jgi:hypothetical protein
LVHQQVKGMLMMITLLSDCTQARLQFLRGERVIERRF